MMNIIGNAIKYTPDGGHIRVTAGVTDGGQQVWMDVWDDGIGIPEESRGRVFERFYRVDKARSRESGGTGLGLSIALEIVQRHHGALTLPPHDGPGTTVRLALPISQKALQDGQTRNAERGNVEARTERRRADTNAETRTEHRNAETRTERRRADISPEARTGRRNADMSPEARTGRRNAGTPSGEGGAA
jgi:hypothetical protein